MEHSFAKAREFVQKFTDAKSEFVSGAPSVMLFHPNSHPIIAGHLLFLGMLQFLQEAAIRGPLTSFFSCHPQAQSQPP